MLGSVFEQLCMPQGHPSNHLLLHLLTASAGEGPVSAAFHHQAEYAVHKSPAHHLKSSIRPNSLMFIFVGEAEDANLLIVPGLLQWWNFFYEHWESTQKGTLNLKDLQVSWYFPWWSVFF